MRNKYIVQRLTTQSTALLEKSFVTQLLKSLPAFYGIRHFITVFTRARHYFLSSMHPVHIFKPHFSSSSFSVFLMPFSGVGISSYLWILLDIW